MNDTASVLIVDDEPSIRLMFRTALESVGYKTQEAGDGPAALAQLNESSPDVMLLDLKMPGMDGMETLRRLRDAGHDTAVVIVTAHGSIPDAVIAMKFGAVDFLTKPVTPDLLRRVVGDIIARHGRPEPTKDRDHGPAPRHRRDGRHARGADTRLRELAHPSTVVVELTLPVVDLAPVKRASTSEISWRLNVACRRCWIRPPIPPRPSRSWAYFTSALARPMRPITPTRRPWSVRLRTAPPWTT